MVLKHFYSGDLELFYLVKVLFSYSLFSPLCLLFFTLTQDGVWQQGELLI